MRLHITLSNYCCQSPDLSISNTLGADIFTATVAETSASYPSIIGGNITTVLQPCVYQVWFPYYSFKNPSRKSSGHCFQLMACCLSFRQIFWYLCCLCFVDTFADTFQKMSNSPHYQRMEVTGNIQSPKYDGSNSQYTYHTSVSNRQSTEVLSTPHPTWQQAKTQSFFCLVITHFRLLHTLQYLAPVPYLPIRFGREWNKRVNDYI